MTVENNIIYGDVALWDAEFNNNIWVEGNTYEGYVGTEKPCYENYPGSIETMLWVEVNSSNNIYYLPSLNNDLNSFCTSVLYPEFSGPNPDFDYDYYIYECTPTDNINLQLENPENVFDFDGSVSFDSQYELSPNSISDIDELNVGELGLFSGDIPYSLSGFPPIPKIYFLNVPNAGSASGTLPIQIKIK